ncbi:DNA polymerase III subunit beta [Brevibacillus agri]|uniref:DNA polymerase III subunit beta n=1 Tax=Brevibacillus agri TaxID=51101 RepID=UPI003D21D71F
MDKILIKDSECLVADLSKAYRAVAKQATIPILTGFHLQFTGESLTITGSDTDNTIQITEENNCSSSKPCAIVVPARIFLDIVRKLPAGEIQLKMGANEISISAGKSTFEIKTMEADEYPSFPFDDSGVCVEVQASDLTKGLRLEYACAVSTTRPTLQGIHIFGKEKTVTFVATDAHRLGTWTVQLEQEISLPKMILPARAAEEMIKLVEDATDKVTIHCTENTLRMSHQNVTYVSRLISGTYPDTSRVIPTNFSTTFVANRDELVKVLERVSIVSKEGKTNMCRLQVIPSAMPSLLISASQEGMGKVQEEVFISDLEGEMFEMKFSTKYLLDALRHMNVKEVMFHASGVNAPLIIRPTGNEPGFALILPVRSV